MEKEDIEQRWDLEHGLRRVGFLGGSVVKNPPTNAGD